MYIINTQDINIYIAKKKKVVKEKYFAYEEGQGIW